MIKLPFHTRIGTAAAIVCTAAVVVALAVIQYRRNQEASDATGVRLADALQLSMINWHLDLFRNLSEVGLTMRMPVGDGGRSDLDQYRRSARGMAIAGTLSGARRQRLPRPAHDAGSRRRRARGARHARARSRELAEGCRARRGLPRSRDGRVVRRSGAAGPSVHRELLQHRIGAARLAVRSGRAGARAIDACRTPSGCSSSWTRTCCSSRILPDLAARYFQGTDGLDYEVAVVSGGRARHVIYASDPGFGDEEVADADGRMDVFGRDASGSGSLVRVFHRTSANRGPTAAVGVSWFPLLQRDAGRRGLAAHRAPPARRAARDCSSRRCGSGGSPSASPPCSCWC